MQDNSNKNEVEVEQQSTSFIEKFKQLPKMKQIAMIGFLIAMICVMIFIVFFTGQSSSPQQVKQKISDIKAPIDTPAVPFNQTTQNIYSQQTKEENLVVDSTKKTVSELKPPQPPAPPSLEKIETPKAPVVQQLPVAPQKITQPQLPLPRNNNADPAQPQKQSSSIMAFGGGDNKANGDKKDDKKDDKSEFLGFDGGMIDNATLKPTAAQSVVATKINNDLKYMLVQGKVIDAVLETAINTQMSAGVIRAVISRDVYGEQGDLILVPKGSRLVGKYSASSSSGGGSSSGSSDNVITRVYASWNRIITPSGVDISLPDTPATDTLGRNGIPGYLDTNLSNNLINAFLISVLGPYIAAEASGVSKQTTSTNSYNGAGGTGTTTNSTVGAQVLTQGLQDFQSVAKDQINKVYPPGVVTNFIDQGTRIDIVVQQDIVFPKNSIQLNTHNLP